MSRVFSHTPIYPSSSQTFRNYERNLCRIFFRIFYHKNISACVFALRTAQKPGFQMGLNGNKYLSDKQFC